MRWATATHSRPSAASTPLPNDSRLRHPLLRPTLALLLALAAVLPAALPASAREPHRPLPNYRPEFVTERERGPWTDCLWASASMLVDKWSAGRLTVSKDRLRRLSGDRHKGSNFNDLSRALRKVGLPARWSPEGGDFVTWRELKQRLAKGGGAILLGDYADLPRWYARWDPKFWRKKGADDNHAIYVDRYDGRRDRFWVMDPLAPAGWDGEWIPARYLRAYAWQTRGGGLWVLMTPAAQRAPFANVRLSTASAAGTGDGVELRWEVERSPKGWKMPKVDVLAKTARIADPVALAPFQTVSVRPDSPKKGAVAKPTARAQDDSIVARVAAPTEPGAYRVSVTLRERRFGRRAANGAAIVFVPGERRGAIAAAGPAGPIEAGSLALGAIVVNTGTVDWSDPEWLAGTPQTILPRRNTMLRATWTWQGEPTASGGTPAAPAPADVLALPLSVGESVRTELAIQTPGVPGMWALTLDIVDRVDGSFAAGGSAPITIRVELVSPTAPTGAHP
jgi:hypothetical protein